MRAIIVDDEARSRRTLKTLCEEYCTDLAIIGMADSVKEARILVEKFKPDLVFLDIEMPIESGFALLKNKEETEVFEIIFTTAYDQYALEAFKFSAVDYLLKPIEIDELVLAVNKARSRIELDGSSQRFSYLKEMLAKEEIDKIALTTMDGYTFIEYDKIVRCEAQGNYTSVFFDDGSFLLLTRTLKHYDEILTPKGFFRVHKSHLINLKYVRKFIKGKQGAVEMIDGQLIEVSARKREALLQELSL